MLWFARERYMVGGAFENKIGGVYCTLFKGSSELSLVNHGLLSLARQKG